MVRPRARTVITTILVLAGLFLFPLAALLAAAPAEGEPGAAATARGYVASRDGPRSTLSVIDPGTNAVLATVPVGYAPAALAAARDGSRVYVTNSADSTVSVIDPSAGRVLAVVPVRSNPAAVAVAP